MTVITVLMQAYLRKYSTYRIYVRRTETWEMKKMDNMFLLRIFSRTKISKETIRPKNRKLMLCFCLNYDN